MILSRNLGSILSKNRKIIYNINAMMKSMVELLDINIMEVNIKNITEK